jgi:hypothetical protein
MVNDPDRPRIEQDLNQILSPAQPQGPASSTRYDEVVLVGVVIVSYLFGKLFGDVLGLLLGLLGVASAIVLWIFMVATRAAETFNTAFPAGAAARAVAMQVLGQKGGIPAKALQWALQRQASNQTVEQPMQDVIQTLKVPQAPDSPPPQRGKPIPVSSVPFTFIPIQPDKNPSPKGANPGSPHRGET